MFPKCGSAVQVERAEALAVHFMMYIHHEMHDDKFGSIPIPCACTTLRKASRAITRLYDAALAPHGMSTVQFSILRNIARNRRPSGGVPLAQLAELLVMERTSLYRTLAPLERMGWIMLSAGGGRTRQATLTRAGEAAMEGAADAWGKAQAALADRVGADVMADMTGILGRIAVSMHGLEPAG